MHLPRERPRTGCGVMSEGQRRRRAGAECEIGIGTLELLIEETDIVKRKQKAL